MEHGIVVKSNALEVLEKQLHAKARKKEYGFVAVGSATDAYMHHEKKQELTRGMLALLLKYKFPVFIATKSDLILRDIDLLAQIDKEAILPPDLKIHLNRGVILSVSISTMDNSITNMLEPGAVTPYERLKIVKQLRQEKFLAGVNAIPVLPFISDSETELEKIISAANDNAANYVLAGGLTLFGENAADSKTLYYNFLKKWDLSLIPQYEMLYRGNFYPPKFYLDQLKQKAEKICRKYKIRSHILEQYVNTI
jgi:DNA repair photolyase